MLIAIVYLGVGSSMGARLFDAALMVGRFTRERAGRVLCV
jgi:hypothetical protein